MQHENRGTLLVSLLVTSVYFLTLQDEKPELRKNKLPDCLINKLKSLHLSYFPRCLNNLNLTFAFKLKPLFLCNIRDDLLFFTKSSLDSFLLKVYDLLIF